MSEPGVERDWTRLDVLKASLGSVAVLVAVVLIGFGRMDAAVWFAISAVAAGASLLVGRRWG